jgi:hypothetical protein
MCLSRNISCLMSMHSSADIGERRKTAWTYLPPRDVQLRGKLQDQIHPLHCGWFRQQVPCHR